MKLTDSIAWHENEIRLLNDRKSILEERLRVINKRIIFHNTMIMSLNEKNKSEEQWEIDYMRAL